nr:MAG TPA: hypothetical protein [Caudoviricetes sp.]
MQQSDKVLIVYIFSYSPANYWILANMLSS